MHDFNVNVVIITTFQLKSNIFSDDINKRDAHDKTTPDENAPSGHKTPFGTRAASMAVALKKPIPELLYEHGHTGGEEALKKHYLGLMPRSEAQEGCDFFGGRVPQAFECGWHCRFCILLRDDGSGFGYTKLCPPRRKSGDAHRTQKPTAKTPIKITPAQEIRAVVPKNDKKLTQTKRFFVRSA